MSIKSEKAKEYIAKNRVSPRVGEDDKIDGVIRAKDGSFMFADSAQKAAEIAESDAREGAVRAHAKECHYRIGDRAICRLSDFHTPCDAIPQCNWKQNFLKHYDNE